MYRAQYLKADEPVALKVISKEKLSGNEAYIALMKDELKVMESITHPYVVRVLDLCEDTNNYYIALELLPHGNLLQVLSQICKQRLSFTERDAAGMIYQVLLAISYFHEINLVHRDLKLENIMVHVAQQGQSSSMCCKVTDFGFASYCGSDGLRMPLGTPLYMAPEIISQQVYDDKVDVWALGVIAFCILTSQYPFDGQSKDQIYRKIIDPNFEPNFNHLDRYWQSGALVKDFIKCALTKDPSKRLNIKQLLQHEWLSIMVDQPDISDAQLVDIGVSMYTFKRTSQFQSFVIQFLVGVKAQELELKRIRDVFRTLDADHNGFLDSEELQKGMEQVNSLLSSQLGGNGLNWAAAFEAIDVDQDGKINYEEFTMAAYNRAKLINEANLQIAFDFVDEDRNQVIEREEVNRMLARTNLDTHLQMHDIDIEQDSWAKLIQECDVNGDGKIDFEEFKRCMTELMNERCRKNTVRKV